MRSKFTWVGLMLAASLALGTAWAGSASAALPELKPTPTEGSPVKFKGSSSSSVLFEATASGLSWPFPCSGGATISGEFINAKEVRNTVVTLKGCGNSFKGMTNGLESEEFKVTSEKLKGHLAYINKAKKEVGLMFGTEFKREPGKHNEPIWASKVKFCITNSCEPGSQNIQGQVITSITPVNTFSKNLTVTATEKKSEQGLTKFEGGLEHQYLEVEENGPAGLELTGILSNFEQGASKNIEVKIEA